MKKKITAVLLAFVLLFVLIPAGTALADNEGLYILDTAHSRIEVNGLYQTWPLSWIFADSDGHKLSYELTGGTYGDLAYLMESGEDLMLYPGEYTIEVTATCPEHGSLSYMLYVGMAKYLYVRNSAPSEVQVITGSLYELNLKENVFCDVAHNLDYEISAFEGPEEMNSHTKIVGDVFYFTATRPGTYSVTLSASCSIHGTISHTITFIAEAAGHGLPEQYGYDETPAESVTVYFTLSSDGAPITAQDGTALAHLEITVPYFDLALYDLEKYYRYHTDNGEGPYIDDNVVERPTGLHLYIYVLERYYMGLPEAQCCKGTSGVLNYQSGSGVNNILGDTAYESDTLMAIIPSQSATSLYMSNFWGHDENLMYYRNHVFPYMSPGWGSTSDYILLSDGDTWDVALFSNWNFWNDGGAFVRFDQESYTAAAGGTLTVQTTAYGTTFEESAYFPIDADRMEYWFIDAYGTVFKTEAADPANNEVTIVVPNEPGEYTLVGIDCSYNSLDARLAPPTAKLIVTDAAPTVTYGDVNGDGKIKMSDAAMIVDYYLGNATLSETTLLAADVNGDGKVKMSDAAMIVDYYLGNIPAFPAQG